MSVPLLLTLLAGAATFIGAFLGVLGQKPSNRVLAFSLGFAAGIMLLISLMEMLPAALAAEGMSPVLGYGMFIVGLLGYFGWTVYCRTRTLRIWYKNNAASTRIH